MVNFENGLRLLRQERMADNESEFASAESDSENPEKVIYN